MVLWFAMIMRVIYKVIKGTGADDVRSDDEGEEEGVDEKVAELEAGDVVGVVPDYRAQEMEVGVEELSFVRGKKKGTTARGGRASGISIPDRKELLGRIGCDKPS